MDFPKPIPPNADADPMPEVSRVSEVSKPVLTNEGATATYLAFDTETTGFPIYRHPDTGESIGADHPLQPRLASIAFITCNQHGREMSRLMFYVKPDGWSMPQGEGSAGEVNGLTDEFLQENGVDVIVPLALWTSFIRAGLTPAAHNSQFDCKIMRGELRRADMDDLFEETKHICTKRALKPYKDQGLKGGGNANLGVACEFFGFPLADAHEAMADAVGVQKLLEVLVRDGNLPDPQVNRSKNRA